MSRREDHARGAEFPPVGGSHHHLRGRNNLIDTRAEVVFAALGDDEIADVLDDDRQLVGADVRVRVDEDILGSAELHQLVQHLAQVAPLGGTRIELAVGEGACASLAVAVVGIGIDDAVARELRHVELAFVDVLAALQDDRPQAERQELERREHAGGTGSHDDHRLRAVDILILR